MACHSESAKKDIKPDVSITPFKDEEGFAALAWELWRPVHCVLEHLPPFITKWPSSVQFFLSSPFPGGGLLPSSGRGW